MSYLADVKSDLKGLFALGRARDWEISPEPIGKPSGDIVLADGPIRLERASQDFRRHLRFNRVPVHGEEIERLLAAAVVEGVERFPEHLAAASAPVHLGPELHGVGVGVPRRPRQEGDRRCHKENREPLRATQRVRM